MIGINIAEKSIALSKHGSLHEKHIVWCQLTQLFLFILIIALIDFLLSSLSTPNSHT